MNESINNYLICRLKKKNFLVEDFPWTDQVVQTQYMRDLFFCLYEFSDARWSTRYTYRRIYYLQIKSWYVFKHAIYEV